jgi:hypothetical protein
VHAQVRSPAAQPGARRVQAAVSRRCAASDSSARTPGTAAVRSSGLTSWPSPPLDTRASRSTRSGNCQKKIIATPPPSEWPTNVARGTPSAESRSRMTVACAPSE